MIIDFSYRLDQLQSMTKASLHHGLRELLRAHRMGHHVLVLPRAIAQWLLDAGDLQDTDQATVFRLQRDFAQTGDLPRRASTKIVIQPSINQTVDRNNNQLVRYLTLEEVSQPYTLERTALIVEDAPADGGLYKLLFEFARTKLDIYSTSFEIFHGGGSRTLDIAVDRAIDRRIACAIIDSDKCAPSQRPVLKVDAIKRRADDLPWQLLWAVSPQVREIENLIPLSIVKELPCSQTYPHTAHLERICQREQELNEDGLNSLWLYFDIKLGLRRKLLDRVADQQDLTWLQSKFRLVDELEIAEIDGFGGNVVEQAVRQVHLHGEFRKAVRGNQWWNLFGSYLSFLIWLCAAPTRQYA